MAGLDRHLLGKVISETELKSGEALDRGAQQMHEQVPRQHEVTRAGGGMSAQEARRAAMTVPL